MKLIVFVKRQNIYNNIINYLYSYACNYAALILARLGFISIFCFLNEKPLQNRKGYLGETALFLNNFFRIQNFKLLLLVKKSMVIWII